MSRQGEPDEAGGSARTRFFTASRDVAAEVLFPLLDGATCALRLRLVSRNMARAFDIFASTCSDTRLKVSSMGRTVIRGARCEVSRGSIRNVTASVSRDFNTCSRRICCAWRCYSQTLRSWTLDRIVVVSARPELGLKWRESLINFAILPTRLKPLLSRTATPAG